MGRGKDKSERLDGDGQRGFMIKVAVSFSMTPVQNIFLKNVVHGGEASKVASEIFETHDFADTDIEVEAVGGAESVVSLHGSMSVKIPFFAKNHRGGDSIPMIFGVEFVPEGAEITVYSNS
jgi:hypothetical protein